MPLHGKIVVVKRSGGDGTEFPLTATCLFGRKPDCDIRIQLPQVSKEHCRIDLNENKEVILTNLSSVNPTRVNGEVLQQSERLKHGDVITIIDRSFRFEYPPAPTPKKRSSIGGKTETFKVLQDQQVGDTVTTETGDKRISEVSTDPHLKDGTNHDNIQRSLEKTVEMESKEDDSMQSKTTSPFNDLYQMIKKSLDVKTPRKSSASLLQTPSSRFGSPKPGSVRKKDGKPVIFTEGKSTPKKDKAEVSSGADETKGEAGSNGTPKSVSKQRKSFQVPSTEMAGPKAENSALSEATSPQKRNRSTPQRFTTCEVIEQVCAQTPKSPLRRRSKEATPAKPAGTNKQEKEAVPSPKAAHLQRASPRNSEKAEKVKEASRKRKSGELASDLPASQMKKKRVSFGGQLSPELFDKRLPPDSPLRKGATPRRSLCLYKPKQSLLRRASVIGLLQEFDQEHPDNLNMRSPAKMRTPSPKKSSAKNASPRTPSPGKKAPKSRTPSPKVTTPGKKSPKSNTTSPMAATPAKKSPKSRSPSPKAASPAQKSPKSRSSSPKVTTPGKKSPKSSTASPKRATPAKKPLKSRSPSPKAAAPSQKSSKSKTPSPARGRSPINTMETPVTQTPKVQGRFSVSRISTPSPIAEEAVADQVPSGTITPKIPLRRKSMKSTSRKTPSVKSAVKVMCRRSGISRASWKAKNSWADIVKFGQTKAQVAAPAQKMVTKKTIKKAVSKPQTPARKLKDHVSTGHADSPATIVVGRAHKQKVVLPTGAAPRLVTNLAILKKNMKMDEDLTGISEMYKTPVNERKRGSIFNESSARKTPVGGLGTSVVEPSVLNTPEEPGEMMVSPLSVSSTVKDGGYSSEAVQRLFNGDQEISFVSDVSTVETHIDGSCEQQCTDLKTNAATTPKQKPATAECLTGVKRIMKTPREKAEPVEDLRGRLLKTPIQKSEQQECLTGVKRIMKTPRQKVEPVEDLRGKILKTPKQKPEKQECLTGVKSIFETPQWETEPLGDIRVKLLETPKAPEAGDTSSDGVKEIVETLAPIQASEDLSEITEKKTPNVKCSPVVCLTGIKRVMKTPKEKSAPVEDMVGVKRLMKTPRQKIEPVQVKFGIKRLMKTPRLRGNPPVEDFEGLQELMEEPLPEPTEQPEKNEVEDQTLSDADVDVAKEIDFAHEEPQDNMPSDVIDLPDIDMVKEADANEVVTDDHVEEGQNESNNEESSDAMEEPKVDTADENASEDQPKVETATGKISEVDADPDHEKESVGSRRPKTVEPKPAEDEPEATEECGDPVVRAPVRGRRGKKTEATAPPSVRQTTRGRNARTTVNNNVEIAMENSGELPSQVALKPKRGRNATKTASVDPEIVQEVATETKMMPEPESQPSVPVHDSAAPLEKVELKPKRGRKTKQPENSVSEQQDVPCTHSDVPKADMDKADANEVCSDQLEVVPSRCDESKSSDAMEIAIQAPVIESLPDAGTATCKVTEMDAAMVQKKSVRGRRVKVVESKPAEDRQDMTKKSEDPIVPATVRGRRGKKTETAVPPPPVRQTKRGRSAKSQESITEEQSEMVPEKAVETALVTDISSEEVSDEISAVNAPQEENDSAPPAEEAVVKPIRGRKTKQIPVEPPQPEQNEVVSEERLMTVKPRRGRKTKPDNVEKNEMADTAVTVESKQPSIRAKRARNAKQEEEKQEEDGMSTSVKTTISQEPVKSRRTRKAEVEPSDIQTVEVVIPEEAEVPHVEPVKMNEQASLAAKPRRGGRKAKQDNESETPDESTEVQEVSVSSTNKPKRSKRGKQVPEEVEVTTVVPEEKPEHKLEAEQKSNVEIEAPVIKPSRARGVKNEVSQAIPAKRARRAAAIPLEETNAESTEPLSTSAEPVKRGRRGAAKPTADDAKSTSDQANPTEDPKMSKRSVKWKTNLEVFDIPRATPVKAVRGRKAKHGDQIDTESKNVSTDTSKTEEKDLSDKVVEAQPAKRARRGAKVADVIAESTSQVESEAEMQPKTRRGRSAKK